MKRICYALALVLLILPFAAHAAAKETAEPAASAEVEEMVWQEPAALEEAEEMAWEELSVLQEAEETAWEELSALQEAEETDEAAADARLVTGYAVPLTDGDARAVLADASEAPTQEEVRARIRAKQSEYPNGTPWTNDNYYAWNGGIYIGGYGCAGFAFLLSDAAFGALPARQSRRIAYDALKSGDILRIDGNTHSVIILEVREDSVIIVEGNYNGVVHWGRRLDKADVLKASYVITRYPAGYQDPVPTPSLTPTAVPTPAASSTPTAVSTPAASSTPTVVPTPAASLTPTAVPTPAASLTPTAVPTPAASLTPTAIPTSATSPTPTAVPTSLTPTATPTPSTFPVPPDEYSFLVTVEGGSGTGFYHEGDRVTVVMDPPPDGMRLKSVLHTREAEFVRVGDGEPVTYIFIMPDCDVTVRAVYEEYVFTVTVTGGLGSGKYRPGTLVSVVADPAPEGKRLWGWTFSKGLDPKIRRGSKNIAATFTMPETSVWLAVIYADSEEDGAGRQWMRQIGNRVTVKSMDSEGGTLESDAWLAAYADGGKLLYAAPAVYDAESGQSSLEMNLEGVKTLQALFFQKDAYVPITGKIYALITE